MMRRLTALMGIMFLVLTACGGAGESAAGELPAEPRGDAVAGESVYAGTCAACHGPEARGLEGLGMDLHDNDFVDGNSDDDLVGFIKVGRAGDDPLNITGVAMLPKGGNDSLTDQDLYDVVAFLRTLD